MRRLSLRKYSLIAAVLSLSFVVSSCATDGIAGPDASPALATIAVNANVIGTPVATIVIDVTAPNIPTPLVFNLEVSSGVATGTLKLPPGAQRTIHGRAFDSNGDVTNEGSVTIDVKPGQNPPLSLPLVSNAGHIPITVWLGGVTLTVSPGTSNVTIGNTVLVTAVVIGPNGQPLNVNVDWATTNPTVATVSASGNVLGVWEGTTLIVATYAGSAATMQITVPSCVQSYVFGTLVHGSLDAGDCRRRNGFFNANNAGNGQLMDIYGANAPSQMSLRFDQSGPFDAFLITNNSARSLVAFNDDGLAPPSFLNSRFHIILGSGDYLIAASAFASQTGAYTMETTQVPEDITGCTPFFEWVTPGITTQQTLGTGDCGGPPLATSDETQIALVHGQFVTVTARSTEFQPILDVGGGAQVFGAFDGINASVASDVFTAPFTGVFRIRVQGNSAGVGAYSLTVR